MDIVSAKYKICIEVKCYSRESQNDNGNVGKFYRDCCNRLEYIHMYIDFTTNLKPAFDPWLRTIFISVQYITTLFMKWLKYFLNQSLIWRTRIDNILAKDGENLKMFISNNSIVENLIKTNTDKITQLLNKREEERKKQAEQTIKPPPKIKQIEETNIVNDVIVPINERFSNEDDNNVKLFTVSFKQRYIQPDKYEIVPKEMFNKVCKCVVNHTNDFLNDTFDSDAKLTTVFNKETGYTFAARTNVKHYSLAPILSIFDIFYKAVKADINKGIPRKLNLYRHISVYKNDVNPVDMTNDELNLIIENKQQNDKLKEEIPFEQQICYNHPLPTFIKDLNDFLDLTNNCLDRFDMTDNENYYDEITFLLTRGYTTSFNRMITYIRSQYNKIVVDAINNVLIKRNIEFGKINNDDRNRLLIDNLNKCLKENIPFNNITWKVNGKQTVTLYSIISSIMYNRSSVYTDETIDFINSIRQQAEDKYLCYIKVPKQDNTYKHNTSITTDSQYKYLSCYHEIPTGFDKDEFNKRQI